MTLHERLGIPQEEKHVVALCGAGGKTTLMYALARECREIVPTALFTSTHIFPPKGDDIVLSQPFSETECLDAWKQRKIVSAGTFLENERKFGPPEDAAAEFFCREGTAVFVESDGSRRLPLKYPGPVEPVILPKTTHVVVVAGLSALGRAPEEVIHRLSLAREIMDIPERPVTAETAAELMWRGYGCFSPIFLLNQADTPELAEKGEKMADRLRSLGAKHVAVLSLYSFLS